MAETKPRARARARVATDEPTPIAAARKRRSPAAADDSPAEAAPKPVEPGAMTRGKLFRLQKGWVFVTPDALDDDARAALSKYWSQISDDLLVCFPSTDLMVDESGRLYVRDIAIAFPEE